MVSVDRSNIPIRKMGFCGLEDKESGMSLLLNLTGIFIQNDKYPYSKPEKIIDLRGNDYYLPLKMNHILTVIGGEKLLEFHLLALNLILTHTNRKYIFVTLPNGYSCKVRISKILRGHKLLYFRSSGLTKIAYCTVSDIKEMEEEA